VTPPRLLLVSLRDPHDAMATHERRCFAEAAEIPKDHVSVHCMQDGRLSRAQALRADAVVFGGSGAYSVLDTHQWIDDMLGSLLDALEWRLPAYASCFGFQGLARALGGQVIQDITRQEMGGTYLTLTEEGKRDPLFGPLPENFYAQQGHKDHVVRLPAGVSLLARGRNVAAQAFKVDDAPFWASQFHPELRKHQTIERFHHYREGYLGDPAELDAVLEDLESRPENPEVGKVLARLARGAF
jgi:GMP synthase (glutamine-hydrolysing)